MIWLPCRRKNSDGIIDKRKRGWDVLGPLLVASVAQLVEQLTLNQLVVGSNPPRGTNFSIFIVCYTITCNRTKLQQSLA